MVRFPEPRYVGTTAEVLAQKPTGYNYDLCPSAAPSFCGLPAPAPSTTYDWPGGDLPFPPPFRLRGRLLRPQRPEQRDEPGGHRARPSTAPTPTTTSTGSRSTAATRSRSTRALQIPGIDADQDRLGVRLREPQRPAGADLRAPDSRASGTRWRSASSGQQFTVLIDGHVINQFDNSGPAHGLARRRPADPGAPVPARLLRPPDPRRDRPDLLPRDPGQGARRRRHPAQHRARPTWAAPARSARTLNCDRGEWRSRGARLQLHVVPQPTRSGPDHVRTTTRPARRTSATSRRRPTRGSGRCRCRSAARSRSARAGSTRPTGGRRRQARLLPGHRRPTTARRSGRPRSRADPAG